jgi:DNA-binding response OmpR family regulator
VTVSPRGEDHGSGEDVLVVESDPELGKLRVEQLCADGFQAALASSTEHARVRAGASPPALIVLGDLGSPRGALRLLEEIRRDDRECAGWAPETAVLVIGRACELDVLRAFEVGADDYLARSARYLELRARVRAILRRTHAGGAARRTVRVGALSIDPNARSVRLDGQTVDLRRQEFELLSELASEPERVFAKDELLRTVWGYRASGCSRTLDSHASRLRRKLDVDGGRRWVINVRGVGYRLT